MLIIYHKKKNAYNLLTTSAVGINDRFNHVLWLKKNTEDQYFIWCLFLNKLATKMNLFRTNILDYNDSLCTITYGKVEDQDHLCFTCVFLPSTLTFDIRSVRFFYGFSWFVN